MPMVISVRIYRTEYRKEGKHKKAVNLSTAIYLRQPVRYNILYIYHVYGVKVRTLSIKANYFKDTVAENNYSIV